MKKFKDSLNSVLFEVVINVLMRKKKTFFAILNLVKVISNFCIEIIIKIFAIEQFYKIRKNV